MATAIPPYAARLIEDEVGTIWPRAGRELVLCYPNTYRVAGASLGLQVIYRLLNARAGVSCQRAVLPEDAFTAKVPQPVRSLEHGMPLGAFDTVLFSIAYELDLPHLAWMLERGEIPALSAERGARHPLIIAGGPLTQSNVLPLYDFVDVVVMGEAEVAIETLLDVLQSTEDKDERLRLLADAPGFWVPTLHGDAVPDVLVARGPHIPAIGQWRSPHAEFSNMALLEAARGCPRYCKFCVVRAPASPMRSPELERVLAALDLPLYQEAPRIGLVGAAVSDWPPIKDALRAIVERGKGVGISSLRADRLDDEFVGLLAAGGYRTLTVASDAASQRLRGKMMKGLRARHFIAAAQLAKDHGLRSLKLYVILGLPDETDKDIDELIDLCRALRAIVPLAITISPFVPKLHTPLADAPFEPPSSQQRKLERVRRALQRDRVEVRFDSPKWAWIEYRLSQGGRSTGLAVWQALQAGGGFAAWKRAFAGLDDADDAEERAAAVAARGHGLWPVEGAR
ncbi:MAG: radical SAM protein [Deltaproteobacteria bacterium]|nr:radical SAM protein [Deltaproteobacteria bacterium]